MDFFTAQFTPGRERYPSAKPYPGRQRYQSANPYPGPQWYPSSQPDSDRHPYLSIRRPPGRERHQPTWPYPEQRQHLSDRPGQQMRQTTTHPPIWPTPGPRSQERARYIYTQTDSGQDRWLPPHPCSYQEHRYQSTQPSPAPNRQRTTRGMSTQPREEPRLQLWSRNRSFQPTPVADPQLKTSNPFGMPDTEPRTQRTTRNLLPQPIPEPRTQRKTWNLSLPTRRTFRLKLVIPPRELIEFSGPETPVHPMVAAQFSCYQSTSRRDQSGSSNPAAMTSRWKFFCEIKFSWSFSDRVLSSAAAPAASSAFHQRRAPLPLPAVAPDDVYYTADGGSSWEKPVSSNPLAFPLPPRSARAVQGNAGNCRGNAGAAGKTHFRAGSGSCWPPQPFNAGVFAFPKPPAFASTAQGNSLAFPPPPPASSERPAQRQFEHSRYLRCKGGVMEAYVTG